MAIIITIIKHADILLKVQNEYRECEFKRFKN